MGRKKKKAAVPAVTVQPAAPERPLVPIIIALVSLAGFFIFAAGDIAGNAPTQDEPVHLASGWSYLTTGDYRLNPEHPPLLKVIAAAPLLGMTIWPARLADAGDGGQSFAALMEMWDLARSNPMAQWFFAHRFFYSLRDGAPQSTTTRIPRADFLNDTESIFVRARGALLLFTGLGLAIIIFCWSYELWGWWGAAISTTLFAFDPNFIAHCGLVTTDAGVSFLFAGTIYFFWRTARRLTIWNAIAFALFFAAALLAKFSAVLLFPMFVVIMITAGRKQIARLAAVAGGAVFVAVFAIWAAYGFRFLPTEQPLPMRDLVNSWYAKQSLVARYPVGAPAGALNAAMANPQPGLIGRAILLADRARLLPQSYLWGFASVQEGAVYRTSYLRGSISLNGFPSYFFWTFLYKTPIPTIIAIVAGLFVALGARRQSAIWFLIVPVAVYLLISITSSLNLGHRHILPVYPFLYVICGALPRRFLIAGALAAVACLWSFDVPVWGQHIAYMNELAGGPRHGAARLLDSNLDWGQDLERLGTWANRQKITEPVNLVYFGSADPRYYGIPFLNLPLGYYLASEVPLEQARIPGWVAISANDLNGITNALEQRRLWRDWLDRHNAKLVDRAGYSIFIYRLD